MRILAGEIVGVLAHVETADQDGAGLFQAPHKRAVTRGRRIVVVDLRAGARREAGYIEQVLDREGHARQRPLGLAGIDRRGALARTVGHNVGKGVDLGLGSGDAGEGRLDHGSCLVRAAGDRARDLAGRGVGRQGVHPAHGWNTGAGVRSSSSCTASKGAAIASERS